MPLSNYTQQNKTLLESFDIPTNFICNSFSFFNNKSGIVIENAISTDSSGNVIFKDAKTQVVLSDLIENAKYITEQKDGDDYILYFQDKYNNKVSLGEIYNNVYRLNKKSLVYWFHERNSKKLEGLMDDYIIENFMTANFYYSLQAQSTEERIKYNELWKNKWIDVPCLEVVTPEYVNSKYASISAVINFKIRCDKPIATGFRLYDATTGIELHRVIHTTQRDQGVEVAYSVPLHYQGPLPDTDNVFSDDYKGLTEKDLQNIQYVFQHEKGLVVEKNASLYKALSISKHVIKVQWITCDLASEFNIVGNRIYDYNRGFNPDGDSSLDVIIYDENKRPRDVTVVNGVINTNQLNLEKQLYQQIFEYRPSGLTNDYTIVFSANKNVNINILQQTNEGFTIKWDKNINDLSIDWKIIYSVTESNDVLSDLYDKNRSLNHYLFKPKDYNIDFCGEAQIIGKIKYIDKKKKKLPLAPPETCFCCECCNGQYSVSFNVIYSGPFTPPSTDLKCCEGTQLTCEETYTWYSLLGFSSDNDDFLLEASIINQGSTCNLSFEGTKYVSSGGSVTVSSIPTDEMCAITDPGEVENESENVIPPQDIVQSVTIYSSGADFSLTQGSLILNDVVELPYVNLTQTDNIKTLTTPNIFGGNDYTFSNINYDDFYDKLNTIEKFKQLGLQYLERDLKYSDTLPVQAFEDNLIILDIPIADRYAKFFDGDTKFLKTGIQKQYNSVLILDEAFLGSDSFRYNFAIFDPRPSITINQGDRPLYPGFDPIYYKTKKEDILKHIYTTMYPSRNVPCFPNFRIGDYVINGSLYNPMMDIRNYRLLGGYDLSDRDKNYDLFVAKDISLFETKFVRGRYFKVGDKYYYIQLNNRNSGPSKVSLYRNKEQWVIPSKYEFKQVTKLEYDLNETLHVTREY